MPTLQAPPRRRRREPRLACLAALLVAGMTMAAQVAAQNASGDYATDLSYVYGGYQRIIALREACDEAVPVTRAANEQAFSKWQTQHRELLAELKRRVTAMIRRASSDQKDYARSLGKYEGAILLSREEQKMAFLLAGHEVLQRQCRGMPELLKGPVGDLSIVFADELETIRKHK